MCELRHLGTAREQAAIHLRKSDGVTGSVVRTAIRNLHVHGAESSPDDKARVAAITLAELLNYIRKRARLRKMSVSSAKSRICAAP